MQIFEDGLCLQPIAFSKIAAEGEKNHGEIFWVRYCYDQPVVPRRFQSVPGRLLSVDDFKCEEWYEVQKKMLKPTAA